MLKVINFHTLIRALPTNTSLLYANHAEKPIDLTFLAQGKFARKPTELQAEGMVWEFF